MEPDIKLHAAEYRFADIVWEQEPIASGLLARLCEERLGWKRTTTYTVLKKLCNRGILMTPFHNMALMSPQTSRADVDRHTEVFHEVVSALYR